MTNDIDTLRATLDVAKAAADAAWEVVRAATAQAHDEEDEMKRVAAEANAALLRVKFSRLWSLYAEAEAALEKAIQKEEVK